MIDNPMTGFTMEIMVPEMVIENEIAQGLNQSQITQTYAMAIMKPNCDKTVDWPRIHAAIEKRWSKSAVERVKTKAWKLVESKGGE
jgi:hypothetical protein